MAGAGDMSTRTPDRSTENGHSTNRDHDTENGRSTETNHGTENGRGTENSRGEESELSGESEVAGKSPVIGESELAEELDPAPRPAPRMAARTLDHPPAARPRRRRRRVALGLTGAAVIAAAAAVVVTDPFAPDEPVAGPSPLAAGSTLATVRQGPLSAQVSQSGTLSFAGRTDGSPYAAVNQARGIFTWLPDAGSVIRCGRPLYRVDGDPVVLLCGSTPAFRDLVEGTEGRDAKALNRNLVKLGYAEKSEIDTDSNDVDDETVEAVEELQEDLNVDETGSLELGSVVFLPGPVRVAQVTAELGTGARPGQTVLTATSDDRQVTVDLNASQQADVKVGDAVQITLPNNRTTPGRVARIGTVASAAQEEQSGSGSGASSTTIPIYITLRKPEDAGRLDQAPVRVEITSARVERALIVPVTALVGGPGGGYGVERVDAAGRHQVVPVRLGLFDNAGGRVQVTGDLAAGDRVVVPTT